MIIALINTKGGVGKTTSCIYLAEAAHRAGRAVTVWDADPQGSALAWSDQAADAGEPLSFNVEGRVPRRLTRAAALEVGGDVIIDTPPGDPQTIMRAVAAADIVIVATGPGAADVDRAVETMEHYTGETPALILLTQYKKNETDSWSTWRSLQESDYAAFATRIPARAAIQRAYGARIAGDLFDYDRLLGEVDDVLAALSDQEG